MTSSSSSSPSTTAVAAPPANVPSNSEQKNKHYLCLFQVLTAGLLGDSMGSDEHEIIEMIHLVIDINERKVSLVDAVDLEVTLVVS